MGPIQVLLLSIGEMAFSALESDAPKQRSVPPPDGRARGMSGSDYIYNALPEDFPISRSGSIGSVGSFSMSPRQTSVSGSSVVTPLSPLSRMASEMRGSIGSVDDAASPRAGAAPAVIAPKSATPAVVAPTAGKQIDWKKHEMGDPHVIWHFPYAAIDKLQVPSGDTFGFAIVFDRNYAKELEKWQQRASFLLVFVFVTVEYFHIFMFRDSRACYLDLSS